MKLILKKGATSNSVLVFIQDSSSLVGAGLTGLVYNSGSLTAYYCRPGAAAAAITLATLVAVTSAWSSGGFKEIDATNMPGVYRLDIPDAVLAAGADSAVVMLKGATNMAPLLLEIQLSSVDLNSSIRLVKNTALTNFEFVMIDSSDHVTPKTGLTVTATRSIDGAAFGAATNVVAEVANGIYKLDLSAADMNGDVITFRFAATGAQDTMVTIVTQP